MRLRVSVASLRQALSTRSASLSFIFLRTLHISLTRPPAIMPPKEFYMARRAARLAAAEKALYLEVCRAVCLPKHCWQGSTASSEHF
jgi:hypothetical protein